MSQTESAPTGLRTDAAARTMNTSGDAMRYRSFDDAESLRGLARFLREGLYIMNDQGEVLDANPAFLEIFGVGSVEDLRGHRATDLYRDAAWTEQLAQIASDEAVREFARQLVRPDGTVRTVLDTTLARRDPASGALYYHGILVDISARSEREESPRDPTLRDPLTGCHTRRYLDRVEQRFAESPNSSEAFIFVDIDDFGDFNQRHGHDAGDEALMRMGRFLMRHIRADEPVVRVGPDEFLILLGETDDRGTETVARRLQLTAIRSAPISFSMGWTVRRSGETLDSVLERLRAEPVPVRVVERPSEVQHRRG
jgi:diguanylate cyclase (GGDEF)-like protein/PAS domain S-box-containing protein